MSLIPLVKIIIKFSLCFGPIFLGIRCLFVTEPATDSFVYDMRKFVKMRGMSRQKWWFQRGILLICIGTLLTLVLLVAPTL